MRQLKFRAWDMLNKKMWGDDIDYIFNLTGWKLKAGEAITIDSHCSLSPGSCVIMQYTGLKDKNGKPIYEGDFLNDSGFVNFEFGAFWCDNGEWLHDVCDDEEIIGNKFENPEFVKNKYSTQ